MSYNGLLNTTCTIQKLTRTQDADSGEWTESWANHATSVKCRLDMASGQGEVRITNDRLSNTTHILFVEYRTDLNWWEYRVIADSITYNILLISQAGGMLHHTEILLELVK